MATKEIKKEIDRVINSIPEDTLEEVLDYLKSLTNKSKKEVLLSQNLKKILKEDKELLERLAQ